MKQGTRVVISSQSRMNGTPDAFNVRVNLGGFGSQSRSAIDLKLDYVSPLYIRSEQGNNYLDGVEIHLDTIPQFKSWDSRTQSTTTSVGMLVRDAAFKQTTVAPGVDTSYQSWNYDFDHPCMAVTPDIWSLKTWSVRLRFANSDSNSWLNNYARNMNPIDNLDIQDWTAVFSITKKEL